VQGEEDEENDGDPDEEGDGFFVPHGYLSEGEGCDDDDDDGKVIALSTKILDSSVILTCILFCVVCIFCASYYRFHQRR